MELGDEPASRGSLRLPAGGDTAAYDPRCPVSIARRGEPAILRLIGPLAMLVAAATVVCCVLGFVLARQSDDDHDQRNRQALRAAIAELLAATPARSGVDPALIAIVERASGLRGLRFSEEPPGDHAAVQSLISSEGRIVGWFSWDAERPATAVMMRLLPLAALIALGLLGFAALAMWQLRRLDLLVDKSSRELHKLAYEDAVTGLPNLHLLRAFLDYTLADRRADEPLTFALIDLGGFDEMKEIVGEAGADEVLIEIAGRLRRDLPTGTLLARMRGDKFGLVLPALDPAAALAAVCAVRDAVSRAMWVNQVVQLSANAALVTAPRDGRTREELMRRAELALRAAKRRGIVVAFSPDLETDFDERRFIKRELSRALAARAFEVHYQPIVAADSGAIVGVEALLRWNHASRGWIPPAVFVRIAEEAGLMDQIGEFVLRRALADAARWPQVYIAVNLSPVQVRDRGFVERVSNVLKDTGIKPSRVVLEITESVLIDDPMTAKARLEDLRGLGVQLALDDFGSGYSSLSYLQQLPFDKLKIDRGFVEALDQSANTGVIIQAIVALGRALGLSVLIEGVETEEQRIVLRLAGCNEMQGYLFAKPAPREEIDGLLAADSASTEPAAPERQAG